MVDVVRVSPHLKWVDVLRVSDDLTEALDPDHCGPELVADAGQKFGLELVEPLEHCEVCQCGRLSLVQQAAPPALRKQHNGKQRRVEKRESGRQQQVQLI